MGGKLWALFFMLTALAALAATFAGPLLGYGFPGDGQAYTTIGVRIDGLFMLILWIVIVVFVGGVYVSVASCSVDPSCSGSAAMHAAIVIAISVVVTSVFIASSLLGVMRRRSPIRR